MGTNTTFLREFKAKVSELVKECDSSLEFTCSHGASLMGSSPILCILNKMANVGPGDDNFLIRPAAIQRGGIRRGRGDDDDDPEDAPKRPRKNLTAELEAMRLAREQARRDRLRRIRRFYVILRSMGLDYYVARNTLLNIFDSDEIAAAFVNMPESLRPPRGPGNPPL